MGRSITVFTSGVDSEISIVCGALIASDIEAVVVDKSLSAMLCPSQFGGMKHVQVHEEDVDDALAVIRDLKMEGDWSEEVSEHFPEGRADFPKGGFLEKLRRWLTS